MNRQRSFALFLLATFVALASACVGLKSNDFTELEGGGGSAGSSFQDAADEGEAPMSAGEAGPESGPDGNGETGMGGETGDAGVASPEVGPDAPEAEACVSDCPQEGLARCADSTNLEMCVTSASGCTTWRSVRTCAPATLCCQGVCRADDTTLPTECVPLTFPPGYDLYVSARPVPADAGTPRFAPLARSADDGGSGDASTDGAAPDASVSDAPVGGDASADGAGSIDGGTASNPLRTITQAIAAAKQLLPALDHDVRIYVARGTYDAEHGEQFPLILPGGITLEGAGPGRSVIAGTGYFNTTLDRGQTFYNTEFYATFILGDTKRTTKVVGFTIEPGNSVSSRYHYGIYCDRGPAPVDGGMVTPNTILSELYMGDRYYYNIVSSTVLGGNGCSLQLRASTMVSGNVGLFGICNQDNVASGDFIVGDGTPDGGNTFKFQYTEDGFGIGVFAQCVRSVSASYNTFLNSNMGLSLVGFAGDDLSRITRFQVDHNTFQDLSDRGLWVYGSGVIADVRDNSFSGISMRRFTTRNYAASAMEIAGDSGPPFPVVTARGNKFMNNDIGVHIGAPYTFLTAYTTPDFGRSDDPGNNVFHCNQPVVPLDFKRGGSVLLDYNEVPQPVTFSFEGNHWDHSPPTRETATDNVFENYADVMSTTANLLVRATLSLSKNDGACP